VINFYNLIQEKAFQKSSFSRFSRQSLTAHHYSVNAGIGDKTIVTDIPVFNPDTERTRTAASGTSGRTAKAIGM